MSDNKKNLIKNTGCCGAVSDAWVPSYPSLPTSTNVSSNNQSSSSLSAESDSSSLVSHNSNNFLRCFNSLTEREDK